MRSVPKVVLLLAALALPIAVVLVSFVLTDAPRDPRVPATVRIGSSPGPEPTLQPQPPESASPPVKLPPPAPDDDDDLDDDD